MARRYNKFEDPVVTAKGEARASVNLKSLKTLWFNTGTRCNLSCENCYIESNPKNDRLVFITADDVKPYLDEIKKFKYSTEEIGLTGGEPFLNPHIISILDLCLARGFRTLLLTNAYRLNRYKPEIERLVGRYQEQLVIRVSLDHFTQEGHEAERGTGTFDPTLINMKWLSDIGANIAVAGRSVDNESESSSREGYAFLLENNDISINLKDPQSLVVFPEMDPANDVPEITTECWSILDRNPDDIMCASSRMIVKRKGEDKAKVLACTLLAYDKQFELGETLKDSKKSVQLNHAFCSQFCVLGGSSCS